jgi:phosphatidylglycerophosphatase C
VTTGDKAHRPTVAAFDVDGTLTTGDSFVPFVAGAARARLPLAFARRPIALARALARRDRDALKELACASLAGIPSAEIRARGERHSRQIAARRLRADTGARLASHRELGHAVVLVSASLDAYLDPLGALLGVDGVLCTHLEVGADGRLTGALDGPNCRGEEKAVRLRAWIAQTGLEHAEIWAYGDSAGDDAMLAMADHPLRVDGVEIGQRLQ